MFKPTFLHLILPALLAGSTIDQTAKAAKDLGFLMFTHNGSVFSTDLFFNYWDKEHIKYRKAILFEMSDLLQQ